MSTTQISDTTSGGSSSYIPVAAGSSIQVFTEPALGHREYVDLYRTGDDATDVIVGRALSEGDPSAIITGPGKFKLVLSETAVLTTVYSDA
jgi:hypothetical protein